MVNNLDLALIHDLHRLIDSYKAIIDMMPDNKRRAALAKHRNISEALSPYISKQDGVMDEASIKQIIIASWRLMSAYERAIGLLPADKQGGEAAKAEEMFDAAFVGIFNLKGDIRILAFEGKTYEPNRPVQAVNAEDFAESEKLVIIETLEPALLKNGQPLHFARVALAGASNHQQEN